MALSNEYDPAWTERMNDFTVLGNLSRELGMQDANDLAHLLAEAYRRDPVDVKIRMIALRQEAERPHSPPGSYRAARGILSEEAPPDA